MRPTNCNFISPKRRTGEYVYPLVNAQGTKIVYDKPISNYRETRKHTFGFEKRFQRNAKAVREQGL